MNPKHYSTGISLSNLDFARLDLSSFAFTSLRSYALSVAGLATLTASGCSPAPELPNNQAKHPVFSKSEDSGVSLTTQNLEPKKLALTPSSAVKDFIRWEGSEIRVACKPQYLANEVKSELRVERVAIKNNETTIELPVFLHDTKNEYQYEIPLEDSDTQKRLLIISKKELPKDSTVIYGYLTERGPEIVLIANGGLKE